MTADEIARVLLVGMCSEGKRAEGCAHCEARLAAVEAVRRMESERNALRAEVSRLRWQAHIARVAAQRSHRVIRERNELHAEVERLRAVVEALTTQLAAAERDRDAAQADARWLRSLREQGENACVCAEVDPSDRPCLVCEATEVRGG